MTQDGIPTLQDRKMYFLKKQLRGGVAAQDKSQNIVSVTFNIDPEKNKVKNEHLKLAKYLKERYLTIISLMGTLNFSMDPVRCPCFNYADKVKVESLNPKNARFSTLMELRTGKKADSSNL